MTWKIVADTSCDLFDLKGQGDSAESILFETVPFTIRVGEREFRDDEDISVEEMLTANESLAEASQTACPSPGDWLQKYEGDGDQILVFTISSHLSGSYNSACAAKEMFMEEYPDCRIEVIDTLATGPETVMIIRRAIELIGKGTGFDDIVKDLNETARKTHIIFALASYHNLIRAGRVSRLVGLIAGHLGFWGIGVGSDEGEIAMRGKARGQKNMIRLMIEEIRRIGVAGKQAVISHCQNEAVALEIKRQLEAVFNGLKVTILPARGLDSYYAERHGLIVAF